MTVESSYDGASLSERAYQTIRGAILRGDLKFGDLITRRKLAKQLGMSLPPVSEALQQLEHEGLVESRPRVGTRVRVPTEQDVRGHCLVREALESQASRVFAEKAGATEKRELHEMAVRLDEIFLQEDPDRDEYRRLHERFHTYIPHCAGYPAFSEAVDRQVLIWSWLSSRLAWAGSVVSLPGEDHPPRRWHQQLAESLSSGDPVAADQAMRRHVRRGVEVILHQLAPYFVNPPPKSFHSNAHGKLASTNS